MDSIGVKGSLFWDRFAARTKSQDRSAARLNKGRYWCES